ncbi:uncharacterized protein PV09_04042 [Verruconis gallopava]|uniref:Uncharacterized protein n=1 Tax=Verruconis gallopava TaxID=253628 RepID=A0A0D2AEH1_9PEZI|nr:uncharacterized protein PV09_04042 [Verruconis gallopava]KIW04860.1 hypothetical protein PV09_04042 [Verruconis gallopava]
MDVDEEKPHVRGSSVTEPILRRFCRCKLHEEEDQCALCGSEMLICRLTSYGALGPVVGRLDRPLSGESKASPALATGGRGVPRGPTSVERKPHQPRLKPEYSMPAAREDQFERVWFDNQVQRAQHEA